jgi:LDH2 family malate/lactate/ureidoglycolate dehydrogenase
MPMEQADRLTHIGAALLRAAGASEEEARAVAVGCVNADGIAIEDATWDKLKALAADYKLAAELDLK